MRIHQTGANLLMNPYLNVNGMLCYLVSSHPFHTLSVLRVLARERPLLTHKLCRRAV